MDKRYQVFISSTYADLKDERSKVMQTIMSLDCIPAGMELFPADDDEQFEFIKKIIDDCDYYVLIVGGRYGSISEDGISYTEKEFDYAVSKGIPVLSFLHADIDKLTVDKTDKDPSKQQMLIDFRDKASSKKLVKYWNNADELNGQVAVSLTQTIKTHPAIGWVRANVQTNAESLQEMNELRKELAELKEYKVNKESELEKLKCAEIITEQIAQIGEIIILHMIGYQNKKFSIELTWKELYIKIAPFFIQAQYDDNVNRIITEALGYSKYSCSVDIQDIQTIKIQFMALDLFDIKSTKTNKGNMGLFWHLTETGKNLMIMERIVKKH